MPRYRVFIERVQTAVFELDAEDGEEAVEAGETESEALPESDWSTQALDVRASKVGE